MSAWEDPEPVPAWVTDAEVAAPCPCGEPPEGPIIMVEGETYSLSTWYHAPCLAERIEFDEDEED